MYGTILMLCSVDDNITNKSSNQVSAVEKYNPYGVWSQYRSLLIGLQSKHDKQQQVLTQAAATQQLLAEVAKGIAGIKQYVSPRCFKHQTICEFSRYDDEYPGDCEPECNLVADREAALHGVLDKQLPTVVRKLGGAPVQACAAGCLLEA